MKHRMDGPAVSRAASYVYKRVDDAAAVHACFKYEYLDEVPQPYRDIFLQIIDWQLRGGHAADLLQLKTVTLGAVGMSEAQVEAAVADDPSLLGLGSGLVVVERQRRQAGAGILDLLLEDAGGNRRWVVELQLGKLDESHIIRTIEYWDHERTRFPDYEYKAVIVAEFITGRFMNVIRLLNFNGTIPLVAIKVEAIQVDGKVGLHFTTLLEPIDREDEIEPAAPVDRSTWETQGSKTTVAMVDEIIGLARATGIAAEAKYNGSYIGVLLGGKPKNFLVFRPRKTELRFELQLPDSADIAAQIESAGITLNDYQPRFGGYIRMSLRPGDVKQHAGLLQELITKAYEFYGGDG